MLDWISRSSMGSIPVARISAMSVSLPHFQPDEAKKAPRSGSRTRP